MKQGWLVGIISLWVIGNLIAGVCAMAWAGTEAALALDVIMRPFMASSLWGGIISAVGTIFSTDFWNALYQMLAWAYPFEGTFWLVIRYMLLLPLSAAFVISLGLATIRGVPSA